MAVEQTTIADTSYPIRMSFSGHDARVYAQVTGPGTTNQTELVHLDSIQTISVSIFREKVPVRALGYTNVRGYTRGPRTIAGSMIFAIFHDHPLHALMRKNDYFYDFSYDAPFTGGRLSDITTTFADYIPPMNLLIEYQNELGSAAVLGLIGVELTTDGITTSIEDILTEDTFQWVARDVTNFRAVQGANERPPDDPLINQVSNQLLTTGASFNELQVEVADGRDLKSKLYSRQFNEG